MNDQPVMPLRGFLIALPLGLLMWAGIIGLVRWVLG